MLKISFRSTSPVNTPNKKEPLRIFTLPGGAVDRRENATKKKKNRNNGFAVYPRVAFSGTKENCTNDNNKFQRKTIKKEKKPVCPGSIVRRGREENDPGAGDG